MGSGGRGDWGVRGNVVFRAAWLHAKSVGAPSRCRATTVRDAGQQHRSACRNVKGRPQGAPLGLISSRKKSFFVS